MLFLTPHFWTFKNHWTCQKSCFLIRRGLKKTFFISNLPQGVLVFAKIRVSCQTFKMDIQRCFFIPHFWPFKNHWPCQKSCFLIRRGLKTFFLSNLPPGVLFCQNKSQLSNLQNGHTEMLFYPPIFDHLKTTGHVRNHVFSSEEGLKCPFFYPTSPKGVLVFQIRVSCQTFKMDIQRCFF